METVSIDKSYILKQLQLNSQTLKDFGVNQIGLFGSYARNEAKEDSDIDFLVDFATEEKNLHNLVYLGEFLEKLFERKVDIVTPQGLSNYIGKYILAETAYAAIWYRFSQAYPLGDKLLPFRTSFNESGWSVN